MADVINAQSVGFERISCGEYVGRVTVEYVPDANYAMIHSHIPVMGYVEISNDSTLGWNDLLLEIGGDHIEPSVVAVPFLEAGAQLQIKDLDLVPDTNFLVNLTEALESSFTLTVKIGDSVVFSRKYPLNLLAFNQWAGSFCRPEVLSAFVTPNNPLIVNVLNQAAHELKELTGDPSLDGYLSQDFDRARNIVAAVYRALKKQNLIYAVPPASFGKSGQRVRLSDEVLTGKVGTCLDLTLLMASCLEAVGMNPVLVLFRSHALLGVWLSDESSPNMIMDDQSFLTKATAPGIYRMVLVESTSLTGDDTFEQAASSAESLVRESETEEGGTIFDMYIDVARCRVNHILPLPQRVYSSEGWSIVCDGESHDNSSEDIKPLYIYDEPTKIEKVLTKQELWERKLLDMTMNNRLLKMVPGARLTQFWSFSIDLVEDLLRSGEEIKMIGCLDGVQEKGIHDSQALISEYKDAVEKEIHNKRLISYHNANELETSLKSISRLARSSMEETGANSLFLALGALRFFEDNVSQKPCYAPLLLVPVNLVRKGGAMSYVIRARDEETMFNTTLREYLRQTFKIEIAGIDPLPTDEHGLDVRRILSMVRKSINDQPRWNVLDECFLGIFSFSKFVMWNDIHCNAEKMKENKVISSLISGKLEWMDDQEAADARDADKSKKPSDYAVPVDADSSQLEAIIESGEGKSFILHGPPGTGKSQTITNIIANALYHGKRVLFVSEKMAALEVVQSRLEKIGIGAFCLELHSNAATKAHVLGQFEEALNVKHIVPAATYEKDSDTLFARRQELITYLDALHTKAANGLSVYDCITRSLSFGGPVVQLPAPVVAAVTDSNIQDTVDLIEGLDAVLAVVGNPKDHPLYGLEVSDCSSEVRSTLEGCFDNLPAMISSAYAAMQNCSVCAAEPLVDSREEVSRIRQRLSALVERNDMKNDLSRRYTASVFREDPALLRRQWEAECAKGFIMKFFGQRKFISRLKIYDSSISSGSVLDFINELERYSEKDNAISDNLKRMDETSAKTCLLALESFENELKRLGSVSRVYLSSDKPFTKLLLDAVVRWKTGLDDLRNWYLWCSRSKPVKDMGLSPLVGKMLNDGMSAEEGACLFQKSVYHRLALDGINDSPALRQFNGLILEDVIERYRDLAAEFMQMTRHELFHKLASNVPFQMNEIVGSSEIGFLKRNITSGGRGTSIRKLIDNIPTLLPKLCPCMLMSPISVAQYISIDSPKFDIVIFDEASQMPTSEALGAIARGKSVIVVGDPKQMPPTDFFQKTAVSEEEYSIDDMESILDDCISLSIPSRYITWHYRSKHESLIAFSNSQYYEGRLFTFPSVDDRQSKVSLVPVKGTYTKGGTNKAEAEAIVKEIVARLKDPELRRYSIGVVSFNKKQQTLIEDMLMDELDKNGDIKKAALDVAEPLFVKNLENVQGDERDVILFSIGYGPDSTGKVSMNFGPLNQQGGQRRLNVAASRARYEMKVFTILRSKDIDLRRTSAEGVLGLKNFLEYAENGTLLAGRSQTEKSSENAIVNQIADRLREKGLEVNTRIGRSNFRIDLGIADSDDPSRYLLGILIDGESYYGTKTARDREIVQPSVLGRLGWNIMKVWTMDWFENSDKVVMSIMARLDNIKRKSTGTDQPAHTESSVKAFNVDKVKEQTPPDSGVADPYVSAEIPQEPSATAEFAFVDSKNKAIQQIKSIVKTESPVNSTLLYRRLREIWGITRMTPQAKEKVDDLIPACDFYRTEENSGYVLWKSEAQAENYDSYRAGEGRKDVNEIPIVEIKAALRRIVAGQVGITRDDLFHFTALRFGITRAGTNVDMRCTEALDDLLKQNVVAEKDDKITVV